VGYFIPLRKPPLTEEQKKARRANAAKVQKMLAEKGLDADQIVEEYERERKARRRRELGGTR